MEKILRGVRFAYDDVGTGPDILLLVHGHPFDRTMWVPQLAAASGEGWRVLAPDLRGYGHSQVVPGSTPLETFADDLVALLDELDADRVVIGGLSMGGQIAMEFCRRHRDRVRGLVLAATSPSAETPQGKQDRNNMADRLLAEGLDGYAGEVLPKMLGPKTIATDPPLTDKVLAMMRRAHPAGAAAALRGRAERPDYKETLRGFGGPALVVVGDADSFTTRSDADEMRDLLEQSDLIWLDGVGHMPNLERADLFNNALLTFLRKVQDQSDTG